MRSLIDFIRRYPLYIGLLPIFFVSGKAVQYYGVMTFLTALGIIVKLGAGFFLFYCLLFLLLKNMNSAAAIAFCGGLAYLFFGELKLLPAAYLHIPFLSKYVFFVPFLLFCLWVCVRQIRRKNDFHNFNGYVNLLFFIFIAVSCTQLIAMTQKNAGNNRGLQARNLSSNLQFFKNPGEKPDIYYLLFDSYPNTALLKGKQHEGAFEMDSFLTAKGFYVVKKARSNYNNTPFSMDATLNMSYLDKLDNSGKLTPNDYNKALFDINHASVVEGFAESGYKIYNLSAFPVNNTQPIYEQVFLNLVPEEMISYYTFWPSVKRDVLWNVTALFSMHKPVDPMFEIEKQLNEGKLYYNNKLLDSVVQIPRDQIQSAKFVYAHFFMPHYPYFYDKNGNKYADTNIYDHGLIHNDEKFLQYLEYTNGRMKQLLDSLLARTAEKAIIIVQSDHGYKGFEKMERNSVFKNINAFYFPDRNYRALYDTMTNVNTFRMVVNKLFDAGMPLLPDTSIELKD